MSYTQLAYWHLATITPAFLVGSYLLINRKGTPRHKLLGRIYMLLMLVTALITLLMPAEVGPQFFGHFGFIHLLSLLVLYLVPSVFLAARRGRLRTHRANMIGLYVGGMLIAGAFTLLPGRMIHHWLFG